MYKFLAPAQGENTLCATLGRSLGGLAAGRMSSAGGPSASDFKLSLLKSVKTILNVASSDLVHA